MNARLRYAAGQYPALGVIGPRLCAVRALDLRSAASAHRNHPGPVGLAVRVDHDFLARHLEDDAHASQVP